VTRVNLGWWSVLHHGLDQIVSRIKKNDVQAMINLRLSSLTYLNPISHVKLIIEQKNLYDLKLHNIIQILKENALSP
jgi:hypothetical protein